MPAPRQNFYEALGVPRNAKLQDVGRAYNRIMAAARKPDAPPMDLKQETFLKEAHETLSDPARREAYDQTLVVRPPRRAGTAALWGAAISVVAGAGIAAWFALRPEPPAAPGLSNVEKLLDATARSVGRVDSLDMSGKEVA